MLVEGPAEIVMPDGSVIRCDRPVMALCTCRRSLRAPFCDTSHRPRLRSRTGAPKAARGAPRPARGPAGEAEAS
nr:CDGSH iron-sulfur domain-containing protein [Streptomyces sp. NK15101]